MRGKPKSRVVVTVAVMLLYNDERVGGGGFDRMFGFRIENVAIEHWESRMEGVADSLLVLVANVFQALGGGHVARERVRLLISDKRKNKNKGSSKCVAGRKTPRLPSTSEVSQGTDHS